LITKKNTRTQIKRNKLWQWSATNYIYKSLSLTIYSFEDDR